MRTTTTLRIGALAAGLLIAGGVATAAAADEQHGTDDVQINVVVPESEGGLLAMTVAAPSVTLEENGSDELVRQFTGTLPTVTVTDTRDADEIADGAAWYVLGSATDFTTEDGTKSIGAEYLGWVPELLTESDSGLVQEGDPTASKIDGVEDEEGLVDTELLASTFDSSAVATEGSWSANAELRLRAPATIEAGEYSSTLTLSLFE